MLGGRKGSSAKLPSQPAAAASGGNQSTPVKKVADPNMTDGRLSINRRCIYERQLPGDAYVTAHAERLQHGYFDSKNTSDPLIAHVDFLAINFVMHPGDSGKHRFKAATIKATIQNYAMGDSTENPYPYPQENPKFLMHAPHLIYGAVSPETLQWTFSLAGSLGISESPVSASVTPSASRKTSYKLYEMMKIQGSCRTLRSPDGPEFDVEDGEIVWSLGENSLQRSGLPREFIFVMLVQKPRADSRVLLKLDIDPVIDTWYGSYPTWWLNRAEYQPLPKRAINFRTEFGQCFTPVEPGKGFNFANLANSLDDYVNMPGSTYSSNVSPDGVYNDPTGTSTNKSSKPSKPSGNMDDSQPVYIPEYPQYPQYPSSQPTYYPPIPEIGRIWQNSSPFQRGWPRGDPYGGTSGNGNAETTVNVRVLLDSNFTSQIAAAALGGPIRHASPLLKAPPTDNTSPESNGARSQRTRSLRRTRSSERLNRLSASPASLVERTMQDETYQSAQSSETNKPTNGSTLLREPNKPAPPTYEINNTPPPNSIRDPTIVDRHVFNPEEVSDREDTLNEGSRLTPPSNGINKRAVSGSGSIRRQPVSQSRNGFKSRYSYPMASGYQ